MEILAEIAAARSDKPLSFSRDCSALPANAAPDLPHSIQIDLSRLWINSVRA
jgi:hypothetical protein